MAIESFEKYIHLKEAKEEGNKDDNGLNSKVSLGDGNDYEPFMISDDPKSEQYGKNKNLSPIVRAFKTGANWGWSKDDSTGEDKAVKISGKKLFLAGGATRDHLKGKKPRDVELATNASPDEVYHLLKQNEFEFVKDAETKPKGKKQFFWVTKKNKQDRPFSFGVRVNEDEFELNTFTKSPKGSNGGEPVPGNHAEDASGRDFTINGMYVALTNDNGPNKDLHDFYGGMHHLGSGKISSIGDMVEKFKEDPMRILRFARMISGYGDRKKVSDDDKKAVKKTMGGLGNIKPEDMMGEFRKGMDKEETDGRDHLMLFKDLGLLGSLFPNKKVDEDLPKELSEMGDKDMSLAWLLKGNKPEDLGDTGLDEKAIKKISFLIKSLGMNESLDPCDLDDLTNSYRVSGVSNRKLKDWAMKVGGLNEGLLDAFIEHSKSPRVRIMVMDDEGGEVINKEFVDLIDPFTGERKSEEINERKRELELGNFKKHLGFMNPV